MTFHTSAGRIAKKHVAIEATTTPIFRIHDTVMVRDDFGVGVEDESTLPGDLRLGFAHVLFMEKELTIQIGDVDRVQIDHLRCTMSEKGDREDVKNK